MTMEMFSIWFLSQQIFSPYINVLDLEAEES